MHDGLINYFSMQQHIMQSVLFAITISSVGSSVRHTGRSVRKRSKLGSCNFHHRVSLILGWKNSSRNSDGFPPARGHRTRVGWGNSPIHAFAQYTYCWRTNLCVSWAFLFHIVNDLLFNKKAQLTLWNPRDVKACKNCSNSACFVSFHRIPFHRISKFRPRPI